MSRQKNGVKYTPFLFLCSGVAVSFIGCQSYELSEGLIDFAFPLNELVNFIIKLYYFYTYLHMFYEKYIIAIIL